MLDPFPIPAPPALQRLVPAANALGLTSLPLHAHEVAFSLALYIFIGKVLSPILSSYFCPQTYPRLNRRTKINWDVHVVSLFQSCIINVLALWVIWNDEERWAFDWQGRIWGYTGAGGFVQAMAGGYFLWDLYITARHVKIFGWGMVAHAVSAVTVFALGFRPFINYYGPIFILYELSSPFLNFHWFLDKIELTGSSYQAINGAVLATTFFLCRLVWGGWNTFLVFMDIWSAIQAGHAVAGFGEAPMLSTTEGLDMDAQAQIMAFAGSRTIPLWLVWSYLASNITLSCLNYYWFGQMITAIRKRFAPPWGTKGVSENSEKMNHGMPATPADDSKDHAIKVAYQETPKGKGSVKAARLKAEKAIDENGTPPATVERGITEDGTKSVEITGSTRRSTRSRRKA